MAGVAGVGSIRGRVLRPLGTALLWLGLTACGAPASADDGATASDDLGTLSQGPGMPDLGAGEVPTIALIHQIRRGEIAVGTLVELDSSVVVSDPGQPPGVPASFVRDPAAQALAGLRIAVVEGIAPLARGERAQIIGTIEQDEAGVYLRPQSLGTAGPTDEPLPPVVELETLVPDAPIPVGRPTREDRLDMVLQVLDGSGATLVIGDELQPRVFALTEGVVVDLRAFDVMVPGFGPGAVLEHVTGAYMMEGDDSALLPRDADDLVFAQ